MTFEEQVTSLTTDNKLKLYDIHRDFILVIGRSGVGKSTMAEILFGDLASLESTFDDYYSCIKINNIKQEKEESSMFQSDTICPQLFTDTTNPDLAIYDCPGFADTRGTSNEIATGVYLSQIIQHANQIKLVVAIDFDSIKPNADRTKFTDGVLPEVLDFVLNNAIYEGGVFLLVTKYDSPHHRKNNFDDAKIITSIANFLTEAQKHALQSATDGKRKSAIKALFGNSWLKKVADNYPNLGFSKVIIDEGNLSDMESTTQRTEIRTQLLLNPSFIFKPADPHHFGCPISEAAKLEVRKTLKNLADGAQVILAAVALKIINNFAESSKDHNRLWIFVLEYNLFLSDTIEMPEEETGLTLKCLQVLWKFCSNIEAETKPEMAKLNETVNRINYLSGVDIQESSETRKDALRKWNDFKMRMAQDLLVKFRIAQADLVAEVDQLLRLLGQRVIIKVSQSTGNAYFDLFKEFLSTLASHNDTGLSDGNLKILGDFGQSIKDDMRDEVEKLTQIISSLKTLTGLDVGQSSATWSKVHKKWKDVIEFMEQNVTKLKVQRDLAEADAEAQRLEAEAKQSRLLAEAQAKAQEEINAAKQKAEAAEAAAAAEKRKRRKHWWKKL